ncbi:MAG: helicase-related protein [Parvularculaceae bacterium]
MNRRKLKPHDIDYAPEAFRPRLTAMLGPTNTGKTHYAIEKMLSYPTGMIGLPLRLLAREVYDRLVARRTPGEVALVTGEEKIVPPSPSYWVSTVEAMPLDRRTDFVAVDEIQLAADMERGRVFTSRALYARGVKETLFLGSDTMRPILKPLFPEINFLSAERLSQLSYAGSKKVTRTPRRTAIVGFSADMVYAIAELVRRQRGGAAVVMGALSPRTRNAQAELYQSGEVDYLIATDAIGMGLNMDIDHVAFAAARKFDGRSFRDLKAHELAQIAGRAGRHMRDGTFGVTADCNEFDESVVEAIENHQFDPVEALQWRSDALDFFSLEALKRSLAAPSPRPDLLRARPDDDENALARLSSLADVRERAKGREAVDLLWQVCQIPDFRKVSFEQHVRLLGEIYDQIVDGGRIGEAFLEPRISRHERTDGDIDAISARIAYVRTWTYLSNRSGWIENASYWQGKTREIEDSLSDALHEKLTQRFVDRRTSILLKKLRDDAPLLAGVTEDGDVIVEGQFVGRLLGFEFIVDPRARGADAKRMRGAAERALAPVLAARAAALANAEEGELSLNDDGVIFWRSSAVAELKKGPAPLRPDLVIRGLDALSPNLRGRIVDRLTAFMTSRIEILLADLIALGRAVDATGDDALSGVSRGVAFRVFENFGAMSRAQFGDDLKQIGQEERSKLRKIGLRFGEYTLHMPTLLKPAAARMMALLWALWTDKKLEDLVLPKPGLVSFHMTGDLPHAFYYALGYRPSGERAVRIDMLERLAQQIRSARTNADRGGFEATSQMMSLVGCSGDEFEGILRSLGYRKHTVKRAVETKKPEEPAGEQSAAPQNQAADEVASETASETVSEAPLAETQPENEPAPPETAADAVVTQSSAEQSGDPEAPAAEPSAEQSAEVQYVIEPAASAEPAEIEVTLWRMAPRRPPQKRDNRASKKADGADRNAGKNRKSDGDRPPRRDGKRPPGKKGPPREPRRYSSEPRRKREADPNSPFAVLAALKADMGDRDGKAE